MPAAAKEHHALLWLGLVGGGGFAAYELFYKPWAAAQALAAAGTGVSPLLPATGGLTSPIYTGPSPSAGGQYQGSIVDPRVTPGGDVGQAMWRKNWTQDQATARLNAVKTAIANARTAIATLSSQTVNPAAAGINAAQAQLAAESAAMATAKQAYDQLVAAGNTAGAAAYQAEIAGHQNDINDLNARIAAAQKAPDNSTAIAAYQGQLAANLAEYTALTGLTYSG